MCLVYPGRYCWIDRAGSVSASSVAPQHDAVGARKHVVVTLEHDVVDLGLRQQNRQLALDRNELGVSEQRRAAEPRAIDDHGLVERLQLVPIVERAHVDMTTAKQKVSRDGADEDARFDEHRREAADGRRRERMATGR